MKETSELIKVKAVGSYSNLEEAASAEISVDKDDTKKSSGDNDDMQKPFIKTECTYVKTGKILGSSINLSNSNIGIGTIGLAFGLVQSGWLLGIVLFIFCHFLNHITMYMMMEVAATMEISTYAIVCNKCKVPVLQVISDYSMVINKLLSVTSYLILIGDYMSAVMPEVTDHYYNDNHILYDRRTWIVIWLVIFVIPCNIVRRLDPLKYVSFFALLCFMYLFVIAVYYATIVKPEGDNVNVSAWPQPDSPLAFFRTISLFIYAYGGHPIAFATTTELINPSMRRLNFIIWNFCTFSTFIFASVAFSGYFAYGDKLEGNLLTVYPEDHMGIVILRVALCFAVGFSYPVLGNVIKNCLASIIYGVGVKDDKYSWYVLIYGRHDADEHLSNKDATLISKCKYYPLVCIVILVPFGLSMITNDLGTIFQFNGATVGTFNQVLFPALIYYFACKNGVIPTKKRNWKKNFAVFVLLFGGLLIPFMVFYAFDGIYEIV